MQIFFSQGIAVLFSKAPDLGVLRLQLERAGYTISSMEEASEWPEMQGAMLKLATNFDSGAVCWVDICDFRWPDDMGCSGPPTQMTAAHAMGAFGPFVNPGALARALEAPGYQEAVPAARGHQAFVRLRISHFFQSQANEAKSNNTRPQNTQPAQELGFLLRVAASLSVFPEASAYFNPNSELLLTMQGLTSGLTQAWEQKSFPVQAVCRVRGCPVNETWSIVDSVGLGQFDLPDHEFCWGAPALTRQDQMSFMLYLILYQVENSVRVGNNHTTDGPQGKRWRAEERENACMEPPRKVLHWLAEGDSPEPAALRAAPVPNAAEEKPDEKDTAMMAALDEIKKVIDPWLPQREAMRQRAAAWIRSPEFLTTYYDDAHIPASFLRELERSQPKEKAQETIASILHRGQQTPGLLAQYQELAAKGQLWFATPLMSNPAFESKPALLLPCGVLVAVDQTSEAIMLGGLFVSHAYALYIGEGDAKKYPGTARMMENDEFRLFYREAFPEQETQGQKFLYVGLMLKKEWMPPDEMPFVPVMALPGHGGAMMQIPWQVLTGKPSPGAALKPGRFTKYAAKERKQEEQDAKQRERYKGVGGFVLRCWDYIVLAFWLMFWLSIAAAVINEVAKRLF